MAKPNVGRPRRRPYELLRFESKHWVSSTNKILNRKGRIGTKEWAAAHAEEEFYSWYIGKRGVQL